MLTFNISNEQKIKTGASASIQVVLLNLTLHATVDDNIFWLTSIDGSVVECSPATWAARVRFPVDAIKFLLLKLHTIYQFFFGINRYIVNVIFAKALYLKLKHVNVVVWPNG